MTILVPVLVVSLLSGASPAQTRDAGAVLDQLAQCRATAEEAGRLACYDAAADRIAKDRTERALVVLDREEVKATKRSLFGFSLPKIRLFGDDDAGGADVLRQVEGKVVGVTPAATNRWIFLLDDKTRWITTENDEGYPPRVGETAVVRRAALGSYAASFGKRRSLKARRIE